MKQITVEMIDAVETLRKFVLSLPREFNMTHEEERELAAAIRTLDEAEAFAEIDQAVADEELSMTLLMMQNVDRD